MSRPEPTERRGDLTKASRFKDRLAYLLVCTVLITLCLTGSLSFVERPLDDIKFGFTHRPASGDIVLVEIDARSIADFGVWPWPRRYHAVAVERLAAAGASRIAYDVDFSAASTPTDDDLFARAIDAHPGKVILPAFRQQATSYAGSSAYIDALPLPQFRRNAAIANLNVFPDDDGRVRLAYTVGEVEDIAVPSLAAVLSGKPSDLPYSFEIDYGIDPATIPRLSYADVLSGNFDRALVAGKQIVIGSTAAELGDFIGVPYHAVLPGPMIHILRAESIIQGRALQRLAHAPVIVLALLLVVLTAWSWRRFRPFRALVATVGLVASAFAGTVLVQRAFPVMVGTAPLIAAAVLTIVAAMASRIDQQALRLLFQGLDIRRKDAMMRDLVQKSIVGVVICDDKGLIQSVNAAALSMFEYDEGDLDGAPLGKVVPYLRTERGNGVDAIREFTEIGHQEVLGQRKDGAYFPLEVNANEVVSDDHVTFVAFMNDITVRRKQEDELAYRADHDMLTGLPNRSKFSRMLDMAFADAAERDSKIAVYLLDLDRFKEVNDTLGHAVGDVLLQDVAQRLSHQMTGDVTLSRFGGDEFAIFLSNVRDPAAWDAFARRVVESFKEPFEVGEVLLDVGGSIGYAVYPDDGDSAEALLQLADVAMYSAKRLQSGFARYWADDDLNSVRNLTLTGDLRRAIEEDELELRYQPKADLRTGGIIGAEVLCRWNRPEHGFVSPDEFINHAEQSGLIYPLTRWVLRKAVGTAAVWRALGWELNVAVNLSARLLHHENILQLISETLEQWDYPANRLTLEITENALLVNPAHAMIVIGEFAERGIKVSIDDFGTGYSSLSYLTTLAADELKIDKSFVLGMAKDDNFKTIVKSVITMAHELKMRVVAEGIETEEAIETLRGFGCDTAQGYFYGKPMLADEFEALLKDWKSARPANEDVKRSA